MIFLILKKYPECKMTCKIITVTGISFLFFVATYFMSVVELTLWGSAIETETIYCSHLLAIYKWFKTQKVFCEFLLK